MSAARFLRLCSLLIAATAALSTTRASAEPLTVGVGLTFDVPAGLKPQTGRPSPIVHSWMNDAGTLSVDVFKMPSTEGQPGGRAAAEFNDWPASGRAMAAGFGDAMSKTLATAYGTTCTYEGSPLSRDIARAAMHVQVETTCATQPEPTVIRSQIVQVLTLSDQIMFRIDAQRSASEQAATIASHIWNTFTVAPAHRVTLTAAAADQAPPAAPHDVSPVSGGSRFRFTDHGLKNPAAMVGEFVGALFSSVAFGALFGMLLIALGLRPVTSLLGAQAAVLTLQLLGHRQDGVWEFDWLNLVTSALAYSLLRGWAQKRWENRQAKKSAPPTPSAA